MPLGWECRLKFVKQVPVKPTERRGKHEIVSTPSPNVYDPPQIFCGPGFGKIRRAPAYTFGYKTKLIDKPNTSPNARMFNVQGLGNKGPHRITHSLVTPHIEPVTDRTKNPGPAVYKPSLSIRYKRPPAYSLKSMAKPPYQPNDMWTPPANMYHPPIPSKKEPAYTLGYTLRILKGAQIPGPGEHDPNFKFVQRKKPAYSFGAPFRRIKPPKTPPPNIYCEKKFMVNKRTSPAPSFGIRHSPYLGQQQAYLKSSELDL